MSHPNLTGLRLLVPRSPQRAASLVGAIASAGGQARCLPVLVIEPLALTDADHAALAAGGEIAVFTSVNAVQAWQALQTDAPLPSVVLAVGAATAQAAEQAGVTGVRTPAQQDTDGLLADPALMQAASVLLLTGQGGRQTLSEALRQRLGEAFRRVDLYRRRPAAPDAGAARDIIQWCNQVLAPSAETMDALLACADPGSATARQLTACPVVAVSDRVLQHCRARGFARGAVVDGPFDDAHVLAAAARLQEPSASATASFQTSRATMTDNAPQSRDPDDAPESSQDTRSVGSEMVPYTAGEASGAESPAPRKTGRPVAWAALIITVINLLLLAAIIAAGWRFGLPYLDRVGVRAETLRDEVRDASADIERHGERLGRLEADQSDLATTVRRRDDTLQSLVARSDALRRAVDELESRVQGGRRLWQLNELEHLLLIANERLQLARDIDGAQRALVLAEERAAALNDPALLDARNLIATEIAALRGAPRVDRSAIALRISSLIRQVSGLPVERNVPQAFTPPADRPPVEGPVADATRRAWDKIKEIATKLFVVRRTDEPVRPLLAPEQEYFLRQNLILQLETARLAVLRSDGANFREAINDARAWTERYFDPGDRAVQAAVEQMDALAGERVRVNLPDISASLTAVREVIERRTTP